MMENRDGARLTAIAAIGLALASVAPAAAKKVVVNEVAPPFELTLYNKEQVAGVFDLETRNEVIIPLLNEPAPPAAATPSAP